MNTIQVEASKERPMQSRNGWGVLALCLGILIADFAMFLWLNRPSGNAPHVFVGIVIVIATIVCLSGLFTLQPNEARILLLLGKYKGTVRESGFHWCSPFYAKGSVRGATQKISLRARTFNGEKLKVNDKRGNPIEIAAVVVWRVEDTAQAMFDVDNYENFIPIQSETALRHLASRYSYDEGEENEVTLRSNIEEVSQALRAELQERLSKAGVVVDEARLTHLAYAPEIAQAMLRRQQAEAVISARSKIVHGAVSMVQMALKDLEDKGVVHLDDERRASMVCNLLVVLCGESEVHPVINTGTLYS